MAGRTERLEVPAIPEPFGIAVVFDDVIDMKHLGNLPTVGTGVGRLAEDVQAQAPIGSPVIQPADLAVRPAVLEGAGMARTAPALDGDGAAGLRAEPHTVTRGGYHPDRTGRGVAAPVAARIHALRRELASLEQQQRNDLVLAISERIGPGEVFSARGLWESDLRSCFEDAGIHSAHALGLWLQRCGGVVQRLRRDDLGIVWTVAAGELHDDAGFPIDEGV